MYINLWYNFWGHPNNFSPQLSQNIDGFKNSDKMIHKAFKTHKTHTICFIFTIYQNYTLALMFIQTYKAGLAMVKKKYWFDIK